MKILKIIIAGLSFIIIIYGCNSGHNTTGGVGWFPIFTDINIYNVEDPTNPYEATTFGIGVHASFDIDAEDDDLDMKTLWITEYYGAVVIDTTGPYTTSTGVALPGQNGQQVVSWTDIYPITISGPKGNYRLDFYIEDAKGNKSDILSILYQVN